MLIDRTQLREMAFFFLEDYAERSCEYWHFFYRASRAMLITGKYFNARPNYRRARATESSPFWIGVLIGVALVGLVFTITY
jgi:hypothetical protein